MVRLIIK